LLQESTEKIGSGTKIKARRSMFLVAWSVDHHHQLPRASLDFPSGEDVWSRQYFLASV